MRIFGLLLFFFFLVSQNTFGCSCFGKRSVSDELKKSDAVFVGEVLGCEKFIVSDEVTKIDLTFAKIVFSVDEYYKAIYKWPKEIVVVSGIGGGDCGFEFIEGRKYIVYSVLINRYYSKGQRKKKFLYTDICSRTCELNETELKEIIKIRKPRAIN